MQFAVRAWVCLQRPNRDAVQQTSPTRSQPATGKVLGCETDIVHNASGT